MAAPTNTLTAGTYTITATGESNGVIIPINQSIQDPVLTVGLSGTFTSVVLAIRARIAGLTQFYAIPVQKQTDNSVPSNSASISLTDSTNVAFQLSGAGYDEAEVYAVSGTPTSLVVEGNLTSGNGNSPVVVAVNTAAAGSFTNVSASGTLAVTGATTLSSTLGVAGATTITSTSASALTVGANGATNPVLKVNANTASVATGLSVTGAAAAGGLAVAVISSGTNEALTLDAKGSGTITLGGTSTGSVTIGANALFKLAGTLTAGGLLTNGIQIATSGPVIYSGSGAPSISAAVKGSLYLRSDGSSSSTRLYVASDNAGAWVAVTTAS